MSHPYDVIVIGAGLNGLTTAALLARAGRRTLLLERRARVGGLAAGEDFHPGYRTDGVLHDTARVRDRVIDALSLEQHGLARHEEEPAVLVPRRDQEGLLIWRDPERTAEELRRTAPADTDAYREYRGFLDRVAPAFLRIFDRPPADIFNPGARDLVQLARSALELRLLGEADMMEVMRAAPMPLNDWLGRRFETEALAAALAAPALHHTVTGPRAPHGTGSLLLMESMAGPAVKGGPAALVRALERAATSHGVEIRTGAAVARLEGDTQRITGVTLDDGEAMEADVVAAAVDPKTLFLRLLPRELRSRRLEHEASIYRARGAAAKVHLALSGYPEFPSRPGELAPTIRIGETLDDLERASDAVKYREMSERPILDIRVPTLETPGLAPDGHHVFSILVHFAAFDLDGGWTEARRQELFRRTVNRLAEYAPGVEDLIVGYEVVTPADLQDRYGASNGHLYHGEHAPDQVLVRPFSSCARYATPLDGLFLCGSGAHPGGGVTCGPGSLAADVILARP